MNLEQGYQKWCQSGGWHYDQALLQDLYHTVSGYQFITKHQGSQQAYRFLQGLAALPEVVAGARLQNAQGSDEDLRRWVYCGVQLSGNVIDRYQAGDQLAYWLDHRKANLDLYVSLRYGQFLLSHFSAMRVHSWEYAQFIAGELSEEEFSVVNDDGPHYLYISAVATLNQQALNQPNARMIMKASKRLRHTYQHDTQCLGLFAEAYSPAGHRLCRGIGLKTIHTNVYGLS